MAKAAVDLAKSRNGGSRASALKTSDIKDTRGHNDTDKFTYMYQTSMAKNERPCGSRAQDRNTPAQGVTKNPKVAQAPSHGQPSMPRAELKKLRVSLAGVETGGTRQSRNPIPAKTSIKEMLKEHGPVYIPKVQPQVHSKSRQVGSILQQCNSMKK